MKFNNSKNARTFLLINSFLSILTFLCLTFFVVFFNVSEIVLLLIFLLSVMGWLLKNLVGTHKIEIDSTSEVLSIVISHPFIKEQIHNSKMFTEFPKERLVEYKIKRTFLTTNLKISFRRGGVIKDLVHNQSFIFYRLNNVQQVWLENELTKIIDQNNEFI